MKYYQVTFSVNPHSEAACDVLSSQLADIGFETFVPTTDGLTAYIQQGNFRREALEDVITHFMIPGTAITFRQEEAPDEDWNQVWEQEGFEPIIIDNWVCVHDTQHTSRHTCQYDITINPRMAFGTGTHPTTRQILRQLCSMDLQGRNVVDAGCGTGVLGILCAMRGAGSVFAYDIDEWSVENTIVNADLNHVHNIETRQGDASVLPQTGDYDLVIANINRNILLSDMPRFVGALRRGGRLLLSGFYEEDADMLLEQGSTLGLELELRTTLERWAMLLLHRL